MVVKDIGYWSDPSDHSPAGKEIVYVDQVRSSLSIEEQLREPPIAKLNDKKRPDGLCVPALRFPSWMKCPACGLLHHKPWRGNVDEPRCQSVSKRKNGEDVCKTKPVLEQVSWVFAHSEGHLGDVPWHYIAHRDAKSPNQKQCRSDSNEPYLKLVGNNSSNRRIECGRCKVSGHFPDSLRIHFGEVRRQPWMRFEETAKATDVPGEIVEVNDARVYSPVTNSALVIPPESRISKGSVVDRLYSSTSKQLQIDQARTPLARKTIIRTLANGFRCSNSEIEEALEKIKDGYPLFGKQITQGLLLEEEYKALIDEIPDVEDDEDFVTKHYSNDWRKKSKDLAGDSKHHKIIKAISHLIGVSRLKEIMVFRGFQRLGGPVVPPDIVKESNWLPALELFGEGIFFTLNEDSLSKWESNSAFMNRIQYFAKRYEESNLVFEPEVIITPRLLLLHTISHMLIRQLETTAGYPAASLKERIYCTTGRLPMAGILIYVAVPDVVGSLGGLTELAVPDRFLPLMASVFDHAKWCSLDPVCSEHDGQGPSLLNKAACHGCALVPEPCCMYGNTLLDRTFVKGDINAGIAPFLDYV